MTGATMETLGLIIKPTRKCNLRCGYCQDWRKNSSSISFEVLTQLTAKALLPLHHNRVEFIWHGGEPLLLGIDFFTKSIALQEQFSRPTQQIRNSIQTNATLITHEWCEFFAAYGMHVGVSIDGPKNIHDINRNYASGKSSFLDVKAGIELLKRYRIPFGVLMVLTEPALSIGAAKMYDFFTKDLLVTRFSFLAARPDNSPGDLHAVKSQYTNSVSYTSFMRDMFDIWYKYDDPTIKIRELNSILLTVLGGLPSACTLAGGCIGQYFLAEPNGDLYHCDKYLGDKEYYVGNITQSTFDEIKISDSMLNLARNESIQLLKLQQCESFDVCNGGCPHDRYVMKRLSVENRDVNCCGQHSLIQHIKSRIENTVGTIARQTN